MIFSNQSEEESKGRTVEISMSVTKPFCRNQADIPQRAGTSVLQILQMPQKTVLQNYYTQITLLEELNTYLWVPGPSIGLSAWISLEMGIRCMCGEYGPFGQQWRLGLRLHSEHPLTRWGKKKLNSITPVSNTELRISLLSEKRCGSWYL